MQKHLVRHIITLGIIVLATLNAHAQDLDESLIQKELHDEGFEDIRIKIMADTLYATIEDRAHRGTFRGAATAISLINERHEGLRHFQVVITDYRMAQLIVRASKREGTWDVSVDRDMAYAKQVLKLTEASHPSTGKLDVTFYPLINLTNNKLDHLFDFSIRIAPAFAVSLWPGARFTVQPIIPIVNNLGYRDTKRYVQLGCTNLSQQRVASKRWDVSAAVGFFHPERYGLQAKATFHVLRDLDFFVDAGVTGRASYQSSEITGDGFSFSTPKRINAMAGVSYYEPHTRLQFEARAGQFLFGDRGGRIDITSHFGEYAIGIYGIYTSGETNAGFHFAIPFGGRRQKRNGIIRLRIPEYYAMEYSMQSYFRYYHQNMGEYYITQPDENHAARFWQPSFVEEYVRKMLNNKFK